MNTMSTSIRSRGLIAAAILGALASSFSAVAVAAEPDVVELRSSVVNYRDLNVLKPQGAAALYGRIQTAAESVCSVPEDADFAAKLHVSLCVRNAIAQAVSAINQPTLIAVYNAKNKTPLPVIVAGGAR